MDGNNQNQGYTYNPNMQNYAHGGTQKRKRSPLLGILTVFVLLFFCTAIGVGGFLGYRYYDVRNEDSESTSDSGDTDVTESVKKEITAKDTFQVSGDLVTLIENVSPAVTTVVVKTSGIDFRNFEVEEQNAGVGTGFFISESGTLITNEHVVCEVANNPSRVSVVTSDKKTYTVTNIASDPFQDIAILQVDTKGDKVPFLTFSNLDSELKVGQNVIAVGNPFGDNPNSVTTGIISGTNRNIQARGSCGNSGVSVKQYEGLLQTDAAINSGNSGGPLLNAAGEVIGVNTATNLGANNVSYAIPYERVVKLYDRYANNDREISFPFLGIEFSMIDVNRAQSLDVPQGALVEDVVDSSPADEAGLRRYDIINKIGEFDLDFSLQAVLNQHFEPGQEVTLEVYRPRQTLLSEDIDYPNEPIKVEIKIGEREL